MCNGLAMKRWGFVKRYKFSQEKLEFFPKGRSLAKNIYRFLLKSKSFAKR
jgi:hypothetical protein